MFGLRLAVRSEHAFSTFSRMSLDLLETIPTLKLSSKVPAQKKIRQASRLQLWDPMPRCLWLCFACHITLLSSSSWGAQFLGTHQVSSFWSTHGSSVAFCSSAKSLTFSGLMETPLVGKKVEVRTSKQNAPKIQWTRNGRNPIQLPNPEASEKPLQSDRKRGARLLPQIELVANQAAK